MTSQQRTNKPHSPRWSTADIRTARLVPLAPLLEHLGYTLTHTGADNYKLQIHGKLILIKDHYWRCPDDGSSGSAIDFFVNLQAISFHQAMQLLTSQIPAQTIPNQPLKNKQLTVRP